MGEVTQAKTPKKLKRLVIIVAGVITIAALGFALLQMGQGKRSSADVITVSTLEKIINVSELSTFTAVYNGIAEVKNEKNPKKTDYYVSYEARVDAGIDFEKIKFTLDDAAKTIEVDIPDVYITEINVDISSLDFIFYNEKADGSTISQQAFKVCEADVKKESKEQEAILELAQQNAVNVVTALVRPIIEQLDSSYTLSVK